MKRLLLLIISIIACLFFSVSNAQVITAGSVTGSISACAGTPSKSPNIQQFTVSWSSLAGNITITAPPGFEISPEPDSGYGSSFTIGQSGGGSNNSIVYVRSAAADPAGSISGNVLLTSAGAANQNVAVNGTVNALSTVNAVSNQTLTNGATTTAVHFTVPEMLFTTGLIIPRVLGCPQAAPVILPPSLLLIMATTR